MKSQDHTNFNCFHLGLIQVICHDVASGFDAIEQTVQGFRIGGIQLGEHFSSQLFEGVAGLLVGLPAGVGEFDQTDPGIPGIGLPADQTDLFHGVEHLGHPRC